MKKSLLFLFLFFLFCNSLYSQWTDMDFSTRLFSCRDVLFLDTNTGFMVGDYADQNADYSRIYKTNDGGTTWIKAFEIVDGVSDHSLHSLCFADGTTGFAAGAKGNGMFICKTTDGGNTWNPVVQNLPFAAAQIFFPSATTGYVCGNTAVSGTGLAKTTDGGSTWSDISQNAAATMGGNSIYGIFFHTPDTGFAATGATGGGWGGIFKTTDGGTSWVHKYHPGNNLGFAAIQFVDTLVGVACGSKGGVYKSIDGGESWTDVPIQSTYPVTDVFFFSSQLGYAATGGLGGLGYDPAIYKTNNGGGHWNLENDGSPEVLGNYFALSFADGKGYACGWKGYSKLNNAPKTIGEIPSLHTGLSIYPNPGNGSYTIRSESEIGACYLEVYDAIGNLLSHSKYVNRITIELDLTAFPGGIYYLKLVMGEKDIIFSKLSKI